MKRVGHNQLAGFDRFTGGACPFNSRRHQRCGKPFSEARNRVERARCQFAQEGRSFTKPAALRENFLQFLADRLAFFLVLNQAAEGSFVLFTKRF